MFLILVGVVFGTMIAHFTKDISFLSWLAFGQNFGTSAPVTLNLGIMSLTLGITIDISVAVVLCIALSLIVGKFIVRK